MGGVNFNIEGNNTDFIKQTNEIRKVIEEVTKTANLKAGNINAIFDSIALGTLEKFKEVMLKLPSNIQETESFKKKMAGLENQFGEVTNRVIEFQDRVNQPININVASTEVLKEITAYDALIVSIDNILGVRKQNIALMLQEQNAICLNQQELKVVESIENNGLKLSEAQRARRIQLIDSIVEHERAVLRLKDVVSSEIEVEQIARNSIDEMGKSLKYVQMIYGQFSEQDTNSQMGQDLLKNIQEADMKIKQLDATIGKYQENAGNPEQKWGKLDRFIQQMSHELPSFTGGVKIFFSALKNNLSILTDEIKKAKVENESLTKQNQKTIPVWKQVVSSLFSWQTAISVGINLMALHGDKLIDWVTGLFNAKKSVESFSDIQKKVNTSLGESVSGVGSTALKIKDLQDKWNELGGDANKQKEFIDKNKLLFDGLGVSVKSVYDAENLLVNNTEAFIVALKLRAQAEAAKKLASEKYEEQMRKEQQAQEKLTEGSEGGINKTSYFQDTRYGNIQGRKEFENERKRGFENEAEALNEEAKAAKAAGDAYYNLAATKELEAGNTLKNARIEEPNTRIDTPTNQFIEQQAKLKEQQAQLKELIARQAREQIRSTEDLWNQIWQAQVDAMNEGGEKTLAQMELNHEKELQAIDREKAELLQKKIDAAEAVFNQEEDIKLTKDPNYKKQTFNASDTVLSDTENRQYDEKYKTTLTRQAKDRQAYYDSEKQAMNEYLTAYGTYLEKRQAIIDMAEAKKKGKSEWEQKTIDEETGKTLSDLDVEANKGTSAFGQLFSDMSKRTVKDLRTIADEAQKALEFVKAGKWNAEEGQKFGISEDTFTEMQKPSNKPGEVEKIQSGIDTVNREADACETSLNKMGNGFKKVFAAGSDTKKLNEGLAEIEQGLNGAMQAGQFLSNALSGIGDAFGNEAISGIADGIGVAMDAVGGAMDGAKAGAAFGPWGAAAGAAIGLVSSLSSSLAKMHDAKNEKRIQAMQEQVEALDKSYDALGDSLEKAYSTDASKLISQQNEMLEQQKVLIQNQILEEKNKKKSDDGRIKEWEDQIESINKQIGQNEEKKIDIVLGSDAKSAIDEFAQAYADAWAAGNDRAKSSKDLVKDMIKQMVMEAIKMTSSEPMQKLRERLKGFFSDGIISAWEREQIEKDAEAITKDLDGKYSWADEYMKGDEESNSQESSTKGGFETMSQETGSELNGRFTALQISNEEIRNSMLLVLGNLSSLCTTTSDGNILLTEMRNLAVMSNGHLEDIAKHTKVLLGFGDKLDKIEKNTHGL